MRFYSTRNKGNRVGFAEATLHPFPSDGGVYVPDDTDNLKRWIYYVDENTTLASIAGALTSATMYKELSPLICETIATRAFRKNPVIKRLDEGLYMLELYRGPSGTFKDYGVSYLASALEMILLMGGGASHAQKAVFLDAAEGALDTCMAGALRDKKRLKSVLLSPKGLFRGIRDEDLVWNGGNLFPIEVDGSAEDCRALVRRAFSVQEIAGGCNLTTGSTVNVGRLLPQAFMYVFAFSRIKKVTAGDIFYAFHTGNYGTLVSGLYAWKLSLPVNGFIVPASERIRGDADGDCYLAEGIADPATAANIERLENLFSVGASPRTRGRGGMLKNFVYAENISEKETEDASVELYSKYGVLSSPATAGAFAAVKKRGAFVKEDGGTVVLIAQDDPRLNKAFLRTAYKADPEEGADPAKIRTAPSLPGPPIARDDIDTVIKAVKYCYSLPS